MTSSSALASRSVLPLVKQTVPFVTRKVSKGFADGLGNECDVGGCRHGEDW